MPNTEFQIWMLKTYSDMGMDKWNPWSWRRHQRKTFSALQILCAGKPPVTCGFPTQSVGNADILFFRCCYTEQAVELTVRLGDLRRHGVVHVTLL